MRRRLRTTPRRGLTLADLSTYEAVLSFVVGWSPALNRGRSRRWERTGWRGFLRDWQAVRTEFYERHPDRRQRPPFAELLARFVRAHGLEALDDPAFNLWDVKHGRVP